MRHAAGFLMLEVIIVLALIVTMILLALPHGMFLYKQVLRSEVEKLASVCLLLRQRALVTNQDQTLTFDQIHKRYSTRDRTYTLASGVIFGFLPQTYGPPSQPKSLIHKAITFVRDTIVFYKDGTMSSGTVYFSDARRSWCYALTTPSAQLPHCRIYEYKQRWVPVS